MRLQIPSTLKFRAYTYCELSKTLTYITLSEKNSYHQKYLDYKGKAKPVPAVVISFHLQRDYKALFKGLQHTFNPQMGTKWLFQQSTQGNISLHAWQVCYMWTLMALFLTSQAHSQRRQQEEKKNKIFCINKNCIKLNIALVLQVCFAYTWPNWRVSWTWKRPSSFNEFCINSFL